MADACCNDIVGGEVVIHAFFRNGTPTKTYEGIGDIRLQPSGREVTAGASSAGSLWATEAPRPVRALLNFVNRCSNDPMDLFRGRCAISITVVELSRGLQHTLNNAVPVGLPEVNLSTGEVTGLEVACSRKDYSGPDDYSDDGAQTGGDNQLPPIVGAPR